MSKRDPARNSNRLGRTPYGKRLSLWATGLGLIVAPILATQLIGGHALGLKGILPNTDTDSQGTTILLQRRGAPPKLLRKRLREYEALGVEADRQADLIAMYANALVQAGELIRTAGIRFPSTDLVVATADALTAGGSASSIRWVLERAEPARRTVVLSRYYIMVRKGEAPNSAAATSLLD